MRYVIFCFGWFNICLGVLGIFIPGLPTTVFFLTALWAFSKSSVRFHRWLYHHPTLGRTIRDWHQHKVIPLPAKIMALTLMTASIGVVFVTTSWNFGLTTGPGGDSFHGSPFYHHPGQPSVRRDGSTSQS